MDFLFYSVNLMIIQTKVSIATRTCVAIHPIIKNRRLLSMTLTGGVADKKLRNTNQNPPIIAEITDVAKVIKPATYTKLSLVSREFIAFALKIIATIGSNIEVASVPLIPAMAPGGISPSISGWASIFIIENAIVMPKITVIIQN